MRSVFAVTPVRQNSLEQFFPTLGSLWCSWQLICLRLESSPLVRANICSWRSKIAVKAARIEAEAAGSAESISLAGWFCHIQGRNQAQSRVQYKEWSYLYNHQVEIYTVGELQGPREKSNLHSPSSSLKFTQRVPTQGPGKEQVCEPRAGARNELRPGGEVRGESKHKHMWPRGAVRADTGPWH